MKWYIQYPFCPNNKLSGYYIDNRGWNCGWNYGTKNKKKAYFFPSRKKARDYAKYIKSYYGTQLKVVK